MIWFMYIILKYNLEPLCHQLNFQSLGRFSLFNPEFKKSITAKKCYLYSECELTYYDLY